MVDWGPFNIAGKVAAVTGASKGIGLAIAKRLIQGGAKVLLVDHDAKDAEAEAAKLGKNAAFLVQDVGEDNAGEKIVKACATQFEGLDILVNNAGIFPQIPMLKMDLATWDRVLRVNLRGLAFISQAAARHFVEKKKRGKIINIASIDSVHPSMVGLAAYDSSKGGVLSFTKNFALELAPHGIQVLALAPGGVATPGASKPLEGSGLSPAQMKAMMESFIKNKVPMGRMGDPDDIAKVAVFMASEASSYMTGTVVYVDGGALLA